MPLDQVRYRPLHAPGDAAVDHDRTVPGPVRACVPQVEPNGLVEVHLDGRQSRLPFGGVGHLHVDLRPVERRLPLAGLPVHARIVEYPGQHGGRLVPAARVACVCAAGAAQREPVPRRLDPERGVGLPDHRQRGPGLARGLVRGTEDVRVVQLHRPHPGQPAEHPGQLGPVLAAQLGQPERQLAVAPPAGPVEHRVVRAQDGPEHHLFPAQLDRREHAVAVIRPVPGHLVQLALGQHRRVDVLVPGQPLQLAQVFLQRVPDRGARGQPVGQPGSDQRVGVEQPELAAELAVIMHGGLPGHGGSGHGNAQAPGRSPRDL